MLAESQSRVLAAIYGEAVSDSGDLPSAPLAFTPSNNDAGLALYRQGVEARAERALASRYPTVKRLLGEQTFAALAVQYLRAAGNRGGDWSAFGECLADWLVGHSLQRQVHYLVDVAQLDNAVMKVAESALALANVDSFARLAQEAETSRLVLNTALAIFVSRYPVAHIWHAHKHPNPQETVAFGRAKVMLSHGQGQAVLVTRSGWQVRVEEISQQQLLLLKAIQRGDSVARLFAQSAWPEAELLAWLQTMVASGAVVGAEGVN
ncbi:HvfC/BufC family peptide modification chaperone [Spongiibacter marinus]|uniref:HvfC/BufC family peptide modification chaperone n=1 Tax=Spongiibacter marinus TaxID=354246 RepID=UPI0035BE1BAA